MGEKSLEILREEGLALEDDLVQNVETGFIDGGKILLQDEEFMISASPPKSSTIHCKKQC